MRRSTAASARSFASTRISTSTGIFDPHDAEHKRLAARAIGAPELLALCADCVGLADLRLPEILTWIRAVGPRAISKLDVLTGPFAQQPFDYRPAAPWS